MVIGYCRDCGAPVYSPDFWSGLRLPPHYASCVCSLKPVEDYKFKYVLNEQP